MLSEGAFKVWADYAATEVSLSYSGTDFSSADATFTDARVSDDDLTFAHHCSNSVLSIAGETTFSAWGDNNFIGSGRVTLNGVSSTLAVVEEQALSLLSYADGRLGRCRPQCRLRRRDTGYRLRR